MWTHFIDKVVEVGGVIGIAAVILAIVVVYLFRQYQRTMLAQQEALSKQNDRCIECMKLHDKHATDMKDSCHQMMREFYDTHRADMQVIRTENVGVMNRVIDSNEAVADSVNKVNNTLANISGRLDGR